MTRATAPSELPAVPAVYALDGGRGRGLHVAYVGVAGRSLRGRVEQHLVRRDSSVTTGASVASINPDLVTRVRWWARDDFDDRVRLEAAELVAFDVLGPVLRSRGRVTDGARRLAEAGPFRADAEALFGGPPSGVLDVPTLAHALDRVRDLEARVERLEQRLGAVEARPGSE